MEDLARRVVACKDWRWLAGMLLEDGRRVAGFTVDGRRSLLLCTNGHVGCFGKLTDTEVVPDLTCASEPGRFCGQLGSRQFGQVPHCMLYGVDLGELDGWVARCAECLAVNPPPPPEQQPQ